jgi:hypothetical protein
MMQQIPISLVHGVRQYLIAHRASIDVAILKVSLSTRKRGQSHPALKL